VVQIDVVKNLCREWQAAGLDVTFRSNPGFGHWFGAHGSSVPKFWSLFEAVAPQVQLE